MGSSFASPRFDSVRTDPSARAQRAEKNISRPTHRPQPPSRPDDRPMAPSGRGKKPSPNRQKVTKTDHKSTDFDRRNRLADQFPPSLSPPRLDVLVRRNARTLNLRRRRGEVHGGVRGETLGITNSVPVAQRRRPRRSITAVSASSDKFAGSGTIDHSITCIGPPG